MVTRQIKLTEEHEEALKKIAPARSDREEVKRRALAAIGRFSSGPQDLSTEHDRYLDEAYRK
jgi:hypothetical protein